LDDAFLINTVTDLTGLIGLPTPFAGQLHMSRLTSHAGLGPAGWTNFGDQRFTPLFSRARELRSIYQSEQNATDTFFNGQIGRVQ